VTLRTTTRSSRRVRGGRCSRKDSNESRSPTPRTRTRTRARRGGLPLLLAASLSAAACATGPKTTPAELFELTPESAAHRALQTRRFETPSSDELLSASAAVLQDLGFQITESDRSLGFLRAAKERSAREYGQEIQRDLVAFLSAVLSAFGGANAFMLIPVDLHQQINASLVAQPLQDDDTRQQLRIVFYRLVWKGDGTSGNQGIPPGEQKMEMLRDPLIYQQFFARLSKAVFLEAQKI